MQEPQENNQSDFLVEKIKERPVNRRKLLRRTVITACMAVIFGLIACFTFLVLEPVISRWLYPEEEPQIVVFPEDQEEMSPEEMLAENMEQGPSGEGSGVLDQKELAEILDGISFDIDNYKQMYNALSVYVTELSQYMVTVTGITSNIDWFNNVQESENQASGVIIAENGIELLILTDYEPLEKAETFRVTFYNQTEAEAVLKEKDETTGIAVLAISLDTLDSAFLENGLKIVTLGSSNPRNIVGIPVVALGRPMGTAGSLGYGIVSAYTKAASEADTDYRLIQTDITGSENAGGVLFNMNGQLIGVITNNSGSSDMKNMITAYGITELKKRIEKMANGEKMAYLGIEGVDVSAEAHRETGVPLGTYITEVDMNSPAMEAGIQQGDVLVKINLEEILSYDAYVSQLMLKKPGQTVSIVVMRQAQGEYKEMTFRITLGEAR